MENTRVGTAESKMGEGREECSAVDERGDDRG